jgi:hypothetical protein
MTYVEREKKYMKNTKNKMIYHLEIWEKSIGHQMGISRFCPTLKCSKCSHSGGVVITSEIP